jgi:hypothetical protein
MTLVWLTLALAGLVWAMVYTVWVTRTQFRRHSRAIVLAAEKAMRHDEDRAWAEFLAESAVRKVQLESVLLDDRAIDRLRHLIDAYTLEPEQTLRVVA